MNYPANRIFGFNACRLLVSYCLTAGILLAASQPALASPELMKAKNCSACHAVDKRSIGPSFKDIATKYSGDPKAVESLVIKVRNGGVGVWGNVVMPANPQVNPAEAEALVRWILTQK